MDIESFIPYLSYYDKIRLSYIDKKFSKIFPYIKPSLKFWKDMYSSENIEGLEYIWKNHFSSFENFLDSKYIIPNVFKDNKLKILEWLIVKDKSKIIRYLRKPHIIPGLKCSYILYKHDIFF